MRVGGPNVAQTFSVFLFGFGIGAGAATTHDAPSSNTSNATRLIAPSSLAGGEVLSRRVARRGAAGQGEVAFDAER
jgi:hypothetical protein